MTIILALGTAFRLVHLAFIDLGLPFRYGGLFLEFSLQILAHGYSLPRTIPFYTAGGIPFAYPPLPFYVQALLIDLFRVPPFLSVTILPPLISILTLPSLYLLTRVLHLGKIARLVSLAAYATLPLILQEHLEGGGLAEAFGSLAIIWYAISLAAAYNRPTGSRLVLAGATWAICILSSPGSAYASVVMAGLYGIALLKQFHRRQLASGILSISLMTIVALAMVSPWWLSVASATSVPDVINAFFAQHSDFLVDTIRRFARFDVSGEGPFFFWNLALFGSLLWAVLVRKWLLVSSFTIAILIPREGGWIATIPAVIMLGLATEHLFAPQIRKLIDFNWHGMSQRVMLFGVGSAFATYMLLSAVWTVYGIVNTRIDPLTHDDVSAMQWIEGNTLGSIMVVVISEGEILEWAAQIMRRTVLNTPYGAEWKPTENERIRVLNRALESCTTLSCIQSAISDAEFPDDVYLYLRRERFLDLAASSDLYATSSATFATVWEDDDTVFGQLRQAN